MPIQSVGGRDIHVQMLGREGPGVIMVHGLMIDTLATWYLSAAPSLARSRRVLMFDLPGHGLSEFTREGYGVRRLAADIASLVDHHFPGEAVSLVGHSFGAVLALRYALDHPARMQRLVLVEPPLPVMSPAMLDDIQRKLQENLVKRLTMRQKLSLRFGRDRANPSRVLRDLDQASRDQVLGTLPKVQRDVLEQGGRRANRMLAKMHRLTNESEMSKEILAEPDISDAELAGYAGPVRLIYGTRTLPEIAERGRRLAQTLPDVGMEWLDGGHMLTLEVPAELTAAIARGLDA